MPTPLLRLVSAPARRGALVLACALACQGSCVASSPSGATTTDDTGPLPEPDMYEDGMSKSTQGGVFTVTLTSVPGPPAVGINTWMLHVRDGAGGVERANLDVEAVMLEDEHRSKSVTAVIEEFGGDYRAHPLEFDVPGLWGTEITIEVDGAADVVSFVFEVEE